MTNNNNKKYKDLNGDVVPRCTSITGSIGNKEGLIRWAAKNGENALKKRDQACKDGDYVHYILELDTYKVEESKEKIKESSLEAILVADKARKEWQAWLEGTGAHILEAEYVMIDSKYGWGGTTDIILFIPNDVEYLGVYYSAGYYIGDYKTGKGLYSSHIMQCGGYRTGVIAMGEYSIVEQKKLREINSDYNLIFQSYDISGAIIFHINKEKLSHDYCIDPLIIGQEKLEEAEELFIDLISVYKKNLEVEKWLKNELKNSNKVETSFKGGK